MSGRKGVFSDAQWPENPEVLHLAQRSDACRVLGPGLRAVLWVQGCPFRCPGCVAPEMQPFAGGQEVKVSQLAEQICQLAAIEGITFSGGEPMAQAAALAHLVDLIRSARDLSVMCYTGYTLEQLQAQGTPTQKALLERIDILVDGPFIASRQTNLRWRGSDNQKVHFLTPRYRHLAEQVNERGYWLEFEQNPDGTIRWMGIPPPGFRQAFERAMARQGVKLLQPETSVGTAPTSRRKTPIGLPPRKGGPLPEHFYHRKSRIRNTSKGMVFLSFE
ncbi:MAG: radical SAM protein [Thermoguttaceae bacterium]|nr:radical SAM protein [Thermoguttaceae bacterium]MDW8038390.1 4Fe-4S single cluster domain-containing protein [Thermoguttaceae bacterium]